MIDSHCHIHMVDYDLEAVSEFEAAKDRGVQNVIVVGEGFEDSERAVEFAIENNAYAAVGVHPHQAEKGETELNNVLSLIENDRVVAIGECGLDYYYMNSSKQAQKKLLRLHLQAMENHNLPGVFHIRGSKDKLHDAFVDFFEIFSEFKNIRGVVHSFSATKSELEMALSNNLFVGINGIATFTKDDDQLEAFKSVPKDRLLLETDAPFLTPANNRGKTNSPKYLDDIAGFLAKHRGEKVSELRQFTLDNTKALFKI